MQQSNAAIVTGASGGIGLAAASALAAKRRELLPAGTMMQVYHDHLAGTVKSFQAPGSMP